MGLNHQSITLFYASKQLNVDSVNELLFQQRQHLTNYLKCSVHGALGLKLNKAIARTLKRTQKKPVNKKS